MIPLLPSEKLREGGRSGSDHLNMGGAVLLTKYPFPSGGAEHPFMTFALREEGTDPQSRLSKLGRCGVKNPKLSGRH